ncbi:DUF3987 domain-containing protein [Deinococcus sp.]|uniref:YfjI family protein n=1 Tax=Deinococcus sp. TaxID=47478 RepID=UPI003B59676C
MKALEQPSPTPQQPLTDLELLDWLKALYGGMVTNGAVEFRLIKPDGKIEKHWQPWPTFPGHPDAKTLEDVRRWVAEGWNVYFGVCLRQQQGVSGNDAVYPTHLLWQDLDLKDAPAYLPEGQDVKQMTPDALAQVKQALYSELMRRCENWDILPAAVVNSGHGLQVFWRREARSDHADTKALNLMLWGLLQDLGADKKVLNPERILRAPGSQNLKNPARPLPVEVWHLNPAQIVQFAALEALKPEPVVRPSPRPIKQPSKSAGQTGNTASDRASKRRRAEVDAAVRGEAERVAAAPEGERNDTLNIAAVKLSRFLPHGELSESELIEALTDAARAAGLEESEISATLRSGIAHGSKESADPERFEAEERAKADARGEAGQQDSAPPLEWEPRQDLPPRLPPVPTMPPEMLPAALRGWLVDGAVLACVPLELFAVLAVAALSGLLGRSVKIKPERLQGWAVVPNLWAAIVGRPGSMKSMILDTALEPLQRLERRAAEDHQAQLLDVEIEREALLAEAAMLKKQAAKSGGLDREALRDLKEREKENVAVAKRYVTQNVTYEKLGELTQENKSGLTFTRDELGSWISDLTREERAEALGFFLTAWNGEGAYAFERIGRGTVRADNPCIAVIGGIQPGPLNAFMARSRAGSAGDSGLLQRFQMMVWPDSSGGWVRQNREASSTDRSLAFSVFDALDTLRGSGEPPVLAFSDEARPIWEEWRDALENRLRGGEMEDAPGFESHISKYRSLAPSLALVFHLVELAPAGLAAQPLPPVSVEALELALNWVEFLELHARKVYALELGTSNAPAYALADKIKAKAVKDGDKLRDLRRKDWTGLTDGLLDRAVEQLTALGWVQVEELETGGRSSEVLRLHPDLIGGEA